MNIYPEDTLRIIAASNAPLRAEKGTLYEGGIREPMIVWWPGKVEAGSVSHTPMTSVDFIPTFAEITGVALPQQQVFDGQSILPQLMGEPAEQERALYWHYPVYHHDVPASAIRLGDWKLMENLVDGSTALYNLSIDPGELDDLSQQETAKKDELQAMLLAWRAEVGARLPKKNPDFDPEKRYQWGTHPDRK